MKRALIESEKQLLRAWWTHLIRAHLDWDEEEQLFGVPTDLIMSVGTAMNRKRKYTFGGKRPAWVDVDEIKLRVVFLHKDPDEDHIIWLDQVTSVNFHYTPPPLGVLRLRRSQQKT